MTLVRALARQQNSLAVVRHNLMFMVPAFVVLLIAVPFGPLLAPAMPAGMRDGDTVILAGLVLFFALIILAPLFAGLADRSLPRREQQKYWKLTAAPALTAEQQQMLALDSQSDYAIGAWNSSLDYAPAWSRMPAELRRTRENDAKRTPFLTMPLIAVREMRASLDQSEHIASSADVELFAADALADASLSARFHAVLHGPDGERMLARLASLTGWSQWDLRALDEDRADGPARLLWGADSQRLISVVRMAHLADHVDAETAWRLIGRAAEPAWGLFDSWDAYWADVRVGIAFFRNSLDAVQNFDDALAALRESAWPAARVPFHSAGVPAWLPKFAAVERPREAGEL